jgi:hypothetical protein
MGQVASVVSRRGGQVFMGAMLEALEVSAAVDAPDDLVLHQPGWTLFTLDVERQEAVFVLTGADVDLSAAAFSYQGQYDGAQAVFRMAFAPFISSGARIGRPSPVIQLFNIGHCGSTLLHNMFNQSGAAWCLSEPLFTFELAMRRKELGADLMTALLRAGLGFLRLSPGAGRGRVVVKHFSQMTTIMHVTQAAEPDAVPLFLYRGAGAWCNSVYGFHQRLGGVLEMLADERAFTWKMLSANTPIDVLEGLVDMTAPVVTFDALAAVAWSRHVQNFKSAKAAGMPLTGFRYEELLAAPDATLAEIFARCGLRLDGLARAMRGFETDSHAGTATARDIPVGQLGRDGCARVQSVLASPTIRLTGEERLI